MDIDGSNVETLAKWLSPVDSPVLVQAQFAPGNRHLIDGKNPLNVFDIETCTITRLGADIPGDFEDCCYTSDFKYCYAVFATFAKTRLYKIDTATNTYEMLTDAIPRPIFMNLSQDETKLLVSAAQFSQYYYDLVKNEKIYIINSLDYRIGRGVFAEDDTKVYFQSGKILNMIDIVSQTVDSLAPYADVEIHNDADRTRFVYVRNGIELLTITDEGYAYKTLTSSSNALMPSISAAGDIVVYEATFGKICVRDLQDDNARYFDGYIPSISPDGTKIVFYK